MEDVDLDVLKGLIEQSVEYMTKANINQAPHTPDPDLTADAYPICGTKAEKFIPFLANVYILQINRRSAGLFL